jgi:hypothetical protein
MIFQFRSQSSSRLEQAGFVAALSTLIHKIVLCLWQTMANATGQVVLETSKDVQDLPFFYKCRRIQTAEVECNLALWLS